MRYAEEELSTKGNTAFMEYGKNQRKHQFSLVLIALLEWFLLSAQRLYS